VTFEELAKIMWYSETKTPLLEETNSVQLGIYNGAACRLGENFLSEQKIIFRKLPKDLNLN